MNCVACGKANIDGGSFCEFCGVNLRSEASPNGGSQIPRAAPTQPMPPSAAEVAQIGRSILNSLSLGDKFVTAGTIAAVLGFFLPWFSSPDISSVLALLGRREAVERISLSGVDLAQLVGAVYFVLLAGISAGLLFYFSRKTTSAKKLLINGFHVMIGSLFGPGLIGALLFIPLIQSVSGAGFLLLGVGFSSIAAGGLISISALAKTMR